jgi:uroporphyrinogen III methyltransferase/synthase
MSADTPAATLEQGTTSDQRKVVSTLAKLPQDAEDFGINPPAITVVGNVCQLTDQMQWREQQPLFGLRIGITRPADRGSRLTELLASAGAEVVEVPSIVTVELEESPRLDHVVADLKSDDWIAFTSPAGAKLFFDKLQSYGVDVRSLNQIHFAAIGSATAREIEQRGIIPKAIPATYSGTELGKALVSAVKPDATVLLPRSAIGTDDVLNPLQEAGINYINLPIYDTRKPAAFGTVLYDVLTKDGFDWIAFTSASTVDGFADIVGAEQMRKSRALCIGEQTRLAAERYGMETITAEQATLDSMLAKIIEVAAQ